MPVERRPGWAHLDPTVDPWDTVEDIEGVGHYVTLGVGVRASDEEIRNAYRGLVRVHHPDKGGDSAAFAKIKDAFDVLSDEERRRTYDAMAKQLKYRYIPGVTQRVDGGEDLLLDEFEGLGMHCDAATQLVVLCEVCGRPGTKECHICGLKFCDFCTRKQHWKGRFPLHWPMVNAPGRMLEELGKKELEKKKLEDAQIAQLEDPNFRGEKDLEIIREFKRAANEISKSSERRTTFDLRLSRFYMWAQTFEYIYLVVHVPTGYSDKGLHFEPLPYSLLLQAEDSPPIIDRIIKGAVDQGQSVETFTTTDNRFFTAAIPKAVPGSEWKALFQGDTDGVRCLKPPYILTETEEEVVVEIELPHWIESRDCNVEIDSHGITVVVSSYVSLRRTFWRSKEEEEKYKSKYQGPVDVSQCAWSLDDEIGGNGEKIKMLMLTIVRSPPTEDDIKWKKGVRRSNLNKEHRGVHNRFGERFFIEDEDEFGLENLLVALCFMEEGEAFVPSKPWEQSGTGGHKATSLDMLSEEIRSLLENLLGDDTNQHQESPLDAYYHD